jgi:hypothetical protein
MRWHGQVLYLEHSVESLARGGPWLLGTMAPGISRWRVLKEAETEIYGGSSRRRLYGCSVTMLPAPAPLQGGSSPGAEGTGAAGGGAFGPGSQVFEQLLLTWSQVRTQSNGACICASQWNERGSVCIGNRCRI